MNKLKILVLTTSYAENSTGEEAAGSFVNSFVKDLKADNNKVEVKVIYPSLSNSSISEYEEPFQVDFLPLSILKITNILHWRHVLKTLFVGKKAVINTAISFKPDHILALWALPSGYWAKKASQKTGVKYSVWCLGSDIWSLSKIPIVRSVLKDVLIKAKWNFADGYQLCSDVSKITNKKCIFLPSSRNLNYAITSPIVTKEKYNLCFIGRWHKNKGIDILIESLQILDIDILNKINCIKIAGGGPLESMVKEKVRILIDKGLPIVLKGFVDKKNATKLIVESDFMLIPSRIESIPVIFSDSIQLLRPVISMPVGDMPTLMKKYKCGVLSESLDANDYAKAISIALSKNKQLLRENLKKTREIFYINQINHVKFIDLVSNHDKVEPYKNI